MKKWIIYFLFFSLTVFSADSPTLPRKSKSKKHVKIDVIDRPGSEVEDEVAERLLLHFLGDRPMSEIRRAFSSRLRELVIEEPQIQNAIDFIESSSTDGDDAEASDMVRLKKTILEVVTQAVEEKHLEAADAQLQLTHSEQKMKTQKYRMYAALATTVTSVVGVATTIVAYNLS